MANFSSESVSVLWLGLHPLASHRTAIWQATGLPVLYSGQYYYPCHCSSLHHFWRLYGKSNRLGLFWFPRRITMRGLRHRYLVYTRTSQVLSLVRLVAGANWQAGSYALWLH
jgi:hypothetical protein